MERLTALAAALLALAASGCLRVTWRRESFHEPLPREAIESLRPGDDLARCLDALGAPLFVLEHKGEGLALAYGWRLDDRKGVRISAPMVRRLDASFDYQDRSSDLPGIVLFFDADWRLERVQRGFLRDLLPRSPRPTPVDDES